MPQHTILGGKVYIYKRGEGKFWQCSTYLQGHNNRSSTKQQSLQLAKDVAEDWYFELRGKDRRGETIREKTFADAATKFLAEYRVITAGERSAKWVESHGARLRLHLNPFFGKMGLSTIIAGKAQEYRVHRMENSPTGKPPARSTLHDEIGTLRQVLKTATRHGWLSHLPDLSLPYKTQGKIVHRPWFSPKEYKQLYEATRRRAKKPGRKRDKMHAKDLHDFVLFMGNTGLRPDEVYRIEHRDVEVVEDEATEETILEIEVRGKRGIGFCKSTAGAVRPYERIVERNDPEPTDLVFPVNHLRMFNTLLTKEGLKLDRDGNKRTTYSLRHTYICMRLMEGADVYQIAKNCRTSVEMIEKFYATHIKNQLDAAAINVRRPRKRKLKTKKKTGTAD